MVTVASWISGEVWGTIFSWGGLGLGHPAAATAMFTCRMCSENPFNSMFGVDQGKADKVQLMVASAVSRWARHAHPRAKDFFTSEQQLQDVLTQLAKGIDREDDPILGGDDKRKPEMCWQSDAGD
eukprot:Skav212991  [mRNA]  locus=scaffold423:249637:252163:- [translate_table: standard]